MIFSIFADYEAAVGIHTLTIVAKSEIKEYPATSFDIEIEVLPIPICKLEFGSAGRTKFKFYKTPYNSLPDDLEEFGDAIIVDVPSASSNCTDAEILFELKGSGGIASSACSTLASDFTTVTITTTCLNTKVVGKYTLTVNIKDDPGEIAADEVYIVEIEVAETPLDEAGAAGEEATNEDGELGDSDPESENSAENENNGDD